MEIITNAEAISILKKSRKLTDFKVVGEINLLSLTKKTIGPNVIKDDVFIKNCEFENFHASSINFDAKLTIEACTIMGVFTSVGTYFLESYIMKNCEILGMVSFSASGFYSFAWFERNIFHELAYFTDDSFIGLSIFRNNDFKKGTNILGGETIKATFENEPIFINNKGPLDLKID